MLWLIRLIKRWAGSRWGRGKRSTSPSRPRFLPLEPSPRPLSAHPRDEDVKPARSPGPSEKRLEKSSGTRGPSAVLLVERPKESVAAPMRAPGSSTPIRAKSVVRRCRLIPYSRKSADQIAFTELCWAIPGESTPELVDGSEEVTAFTKMIISEDNLLYQILWYDDDLVIFAGRTPSRWIDAPTAAALVLFERRRRATSASGAARVLVVYLEFIEHVRFVHDPWEQWPPAVTGIDHREQCIDGRSMLGHVRSMIGVGKTNDEIIIVIASSVMSADAEELVRFATGEGICLVSSDGLRREFALAVFSRLRMRTEQRLVQGTAGFLRLPVTVWGNVFEERFAVDSEGPGARRVFRLPGNWAGKTLEFTFQTEPDLGDSSTSQRFSATLPSRRTTGQMGRVLLEFLVCKPNGVILARLWNLFREDVRCSVCGDKKPRKMLESGLSKCLGCGDAVQLKSLKPRVVRECLGVIRPVEADPEELDPRTKPLPVLVCAGLEGKCLASPHFERTARLIDDLYFAGRLDHVAVDWAGIGAARRSFGSWPAEALASGGFKALAERILAGRIALEPSRGLDDSLRRALAPTRWVETLANGILAIVSSGDRHDLGSTPTFRDAAKRWDWVLTIRREIGCPIHWGAFVEVGPERAAVRDALAHVVLLGRQAICAENLVRDWSAPLRTTVPDGSSALVIAAANSLAAGRRKAGLALGVVAEEIGTI